MPMYEVDYTYTVEEYGVVQLEADTPEIAEERAIEEVKEMYDDIKDITVDAVRELKS